MESTRWKSSLEFGLDSITESNCVLARGGGEQLEVNDRSVGFDELDSAYRRGEPARLWRSPNDAVVPATGMRTIRTIVTRGKPMVQKQTKAMGRRRVVGDGMVRRFYV